jgi:hypothetical protein
MGKRGEPILFWREQGIERGKAMKRESSTSSDISNAVLATRYLALQELREKVRRAEERSSSTRIKKVSFFQPAPKSDNRVLPKSRNS